MCSMVCRWTAPIGSQLKFNWDAAISSNSSGLGGCIRDKEGEVILSFSCNLHSLLEPIIVEAMALRKVMLICKELNLSMIAFEGDCLQVVSAASSHMPSHDLLAPILFDIHHMQERAHNWTVLYTRRNANRV